MGQRERLSGALSKSGRVSQSNATRNTREAARASRSGHGPGAPGRAEAGVGVCATPRDAAAPSPRLPAPQRRPTGAAPRKGCRQGPHGPNSSLRQAPGPPAGCRRPRTRPPLGLPRPLRAGRTRQPIGRHAALAPPLTHYQSRSDRSRLSEEARVAGDCDASAGVLGP